ncbi:MAG: FMN-binding protein [Candidatus Poribacteria bacterium]
MKPALKILIFCLIMGTVSGALIVGINAWTSARIAKYEEIKLKSSVLDVLEIPYTEGNIIDVFKDNVDLIEKGKRTIYKSKDNAIAFEFKGSGVWGEIYGIISLNPDLYTIRNIKIIHQEETPGLGSRIADSEYLKYFKNKTIYPELVFMPVGKAKEDNEVDIITGATYSSKALERILNKAITDVAVLLDK